MQENILSVETDPMVMHISLCNQPFCSLVPSDRRGARAAPNKQQPRLNQPGPAPIGLAPCFCSAAGLVRLRDMEMRADTRQFHRRQS